MDVPDVAEAAVDNAAYIKQKREELRVFFKDAKLPQVVIDKAIENELKPLLEGTRPYIKASSIGEIKTEFEVMSGQPFTEVGEHTKPLSGSEVREMLKDNPILAEKARQIQIMKSPTNNKFVAVPLDEINLKSFIDMRSEISAAAGDSKKIDKINYNNMTSLMNSLVEYQAKSQEVKTNTIKEEPEGEEQDENEREYEEIEKVVSKYTDKSYETRFQETKDMLSKLADKFEDPKLQNSKKPFKMEIPPDPVLRESSVQMIKGQIRPTVFQEVKETFAINKAMNISLNRVTATLDAKKKKEPTKKEEEEVIDAETVFPKSISMKLKDTEQALRNINSIFMSIPNADAKIEVSDRNNEVVSESVDASESETNENIRTKAKNEILNENQVKFDEKMEQTLHSALENIFEISNDENQVNKELEFKEMKNLARNIVEGAENLSTLIREDITNKLNSMNELLNDVNQALENSKQSNIAYQKIKEEGEALQRERNSKVGKVTVTEIAEDTQEDIINANLLVKESNTSGVTNAEINDIRSAINKLNSELVCHEDRINKSKQRYEMRNKECKDFIDEVSVIMQKSKEILHPKEVAQEKALLQKTEDAESVEQVNENGEKKHKDVWDKDIESYKCQTNIKLEQFKQQESERSNRIDNLLHEIKDKMKDNKEVLRLANNLLRREENKKKVLDENEAKKKSYSDYANMDSKAQGDHKHVEYKSSYQELKNKIPLISEMPPVEGAIKGIVYL